LIHDYNLLLHYIDIILTLETQIETSDKVSITINNDNLSRYVLSMGNARDLEEYMNELLDQSDPRTKVFVDELLNRWRDSQCMNTSSKKYMVSINIEVKNNVVEECNI